MAHSDSQSVYKPGRPTIQGKNERFHQTLFKWLDKQPIAQNLEQLQEFVDRFDLIYNTQRPQQALPGRITPQQSWDATELAVEPRPSDGDTGLRLPAVDQPSKLMPQLKSLLRMPSRLMMRSAR